MNTKSGLPLFNDMRVVTNFVPYLELTGWKQNGKQDSRWYTFLGPKDASDSLIELVLPKNPQARDLESYLANAVELLAAISDESEDITLRRITYFDRDVLSLKNIETGERNTITLDLAATQVSKLKQLVAYAACSEQEAKPYFVQALNIAGQMTSQYQFGHTFTGSFGLTIESPIVHSATTFMRERMSDVGDETKVESFQNMPIERRVMERIIRGLKLSNLATQEQSFKTIVQGYREAFNANMCESIDGMARTGYKERAPLEYSVLWSPKIKTAEDLTGLKPIKLVPTSYHLLKAAAAELKTLEPDYIQIQGHVKGLSTSYDPQSDAAIKRSIVLRGRLKDDSKPTDILVELKRDDYLSACDAHREWSTISVSGILGRAGNSWRLYDARDYKVISK